MRSEHPSVTDELQAFVGQHVETQQREASSVVRELLVFRFAGCDWAVDAAHVDGVIPWRAPMPLPQASPSVHGVVQDRGRIVVVLTDPKGAGAQNPGTDPARIVVCNTPRGHVGLPAALTRTVGSVELQQEPIAGQVVASSAGPITYLNPSGFFEET